MGTLNGRVAVVTGAGRGIGREHALLLAREGAKVLVNDLGGANDGTGSDTGPAQQVAEEINAAGGEANWNTDDVSTWAGAEQLIEQAVDEFGGLDILVNNAGWTHRNKPMLNVTEEEFDRIYAVNVKSLFHSAKSGVPEMKKRGGGVILNIASTAGVRPRPGLTWYNGSKGAAITLTRSMAAELAPEKIRVCAINPVIGETGLLSEFMGGADTPELRAKFVSTIPLGRMSRPKDIADAALFLCCGEAEFLTGVCLEVDGGRCI